MKNVRKGEEYVGALVWGLFIWGGMYLWKNYIKPKAETVRMIEIEVNQTACLFVARERE